VFCSKGLWVLLEVFTRCLHGPDYVICLQVEVDRFLSTSILIKDVTCQRYSVPTTIFPAFPMLDIMGDTDGELAPFFDAKTGIQVPSWAAVADMPSLSASLKRAAAVLARDERTTFKDACRPPSTKKGAKPPPDAPLPLNIAPEVLDAADAFCGAILERERTILRERLQSVAAHASVDASDAQALMSVTSDRLKAATKARFVAECESVASVIVVLSGAVVKSETLPYDLVLSDDGVIIDLNARVIPPQSPKRHVDPEEQPLAPGLLSLKQIMCLISVAKDVTTCEFISTRGCTDLLQGLTATVSGPYSVTFPAEWRKATRSQMHGAISQMDANCSCHIDWLELATGLLIHSRPVLTGVTAKALAAAAIALAQADGDKDGAVTLEEWMDCPVWFQPKPAPCDDGCAATAGEFCITGLFMLHWSSKIWRCIIYGFKPWALALESFDNITWHNNVAWLLFKS
jgi:hypothetical protein